MYEISEYEKEIQYITLNFLHWWYQARGLIFFMVLRPQLFFSGTRVILWQYVALQFSSNTKQGNPVGTISPTLKIGQISTDKNGVT